MTPALLARLTDSPPVAICSYCPGWKHDAPENKGASHGICPACAAKLEGQAAS